jgi:flagellar hook-associated protein 2
MQLRSPGLGSGLDINSLVEQLVAAERAPITAQITRRETKATLQVSALAQLKGAMSSFKDSLEPLKDAASFSPRKATSADDSIFTVTANTNAASGAYAVEVVELAGAQQLSSAAFAGGVTSAIGTGTLSITQAGVSFSVTIDSSNNTLAGIRDAINTAAGNQGVQATVINEVNGSRLIVSSNKTGAVHALRITQSGGDNGLAALVYDPGVSTTLTEIKAASDAHIRIAGFDHYSETNSISNAIDGITLTLNAESDGETVQLNVSEDSQALNERIKKFVDEYNAMQTVFARLRVFVPGSDNNGPLLGDALLRSIEDEIRFDLAQPVTGVLGNFTTLNSIGIIKKVDGTLEFDQSKFDAALTSDRNSVNTIFSGEAGVATRLFDHLTARLDIEAALETRNEGLQASLKTIENDKAVLEERMTAIEERYRRQFTALDQLLAGLSTTANFLASQLENLPKPRSSSR